MVPENVLAQPKNAFVPQPENALAQPENAFVPQPENALAQPENAHVTDKANILASSQERLTRRYGNTFMHPLQFVHVSFIIVS
jgi:hypothetical protein